VNPGPLPWLVAGCLGLALAGIAALYVLDLSKATLLEDQNQLGKLKLQSLNNRLEAERIISARELADTAAQDNGLLARLQFFSLGPAEGGPQGATGIALWDPIRNEGLLSASGLPAVSPGEEYDVWLVDADRPEPAYGGVMIPDPRSGLLRASFMVDRPAASIGRIVVGCTKKNTDPLHAPGRVILTSR